MWDEEVCSSLVERSCPILRKAMSHAMLRSAKKAIRRQVEKETKLV